MSFLVTGPVRSARSPLATPSVDRPHCRFAPAMPTNQSVPAQPSADHGSARHLGWGRWSASVKASPPTAIGRHRPAKQNQSSLAFVNFHFVFGDFVPVNSKKCDAGTRHRPTGNLRPSERKFTTGGPLSRADGKPHRNSENSFVPSWRRRMTGARSVGQMSSRGPKLGHFTEMRV